MSDHIIINDAGEDVLCLGCPECDPSQIPPMHAAEIIGELAALRAEVAGLRASLFVSLDNCTTELDGRIRTIEHKLNLI